MAAALEPRAAPGRASLAVPAWIHPAMGWGHRFQPARCEAGSLGLLLSLTGCAGELAAPSQLHCSQSLTSCKGCHSWLVSAAALNCCSSELLQLGLSVAGAVQQPELRDHLWGHLEALQPVLGMHKSLPQQGEHSSGRSCVQAVPSSQVWLRNAHCIQTPELQARWVMLNSALWDP